MPFHRTLIASLLVLGANPVCALEYRAELGTEVWGFAHEGAQGQSAGVAAASFKTDLWQQWNDGSDTLTFTPFLRYDSADRERRHADIRQLEWLHVSGAYELRSGVRQVFWGVTEATHLVDIINQTDLVEALNSEQKLGQPMLNLAWERDAHSLDLFALIGTRERSYPGKDGRLRLPLAVDTGLARFESRQGRNRVDSALRYQFNHAGLRLGLTGFSGTAREPELQPVVDASRLIYAGNQPVAFQNGYQPVLAPYYPLISQAGLDLQYTAGDWLWKLEAIDRKSQGHHFQAVDAGVEYTRISVFDSGFDLGLLTEILYDSRGHAATTPFEHDLMLGTRLAFNDVASSELLASVIIDKNSHEQLWSLEASRRLAENWKLALEARVFSHTPAAQSAFEFLASPDTEHKLRSLAQDDFLRLELTFFF